MGHTESSDADLRALVIELRTEVATLHTALGRTLAALEVATTNSLGDDLDYHYHCLSESTQASIQRIRHDLARQEWEQLSGVYEAAIRKYADAHAASPSYDHTPAEVTR